MSEQSPVYDVAIVGLGPTGATLANLLGAAGHSVLVVEKEAGLFPLPRAIHYDGEVLRIFQAAGLREQVLAISRPGTQGMHFVNAAGQTLLIRGGTAALGPHGCANNYYFHQPELEAVLRAGLARFPNVDVRLGTAVSAVEQDAEGATLSCECTGDGTRFQARARWVVGCDGARSPVRQHMGSPMVDLGLRQPWLVFDVVLTEPVDLPPHTVQHCDPRRPMTYCNVVGNRRRWEIMVLPGDDREALVQPETLWTLVAPWVRPDQARLERAAIYTFHSVIAEGWVRSRTIATAALRSAACLRNSHGTWSAYRAAEVTNSQRSAAPSSCAASVRFCSSTESMSGASSTASPGGIAAEDTSWSAPGSADARVVRSRSGRIRALSNQSASCGLCTRTGDRVVGRSTPVSVTRSPTSEFTSVDLPAPVEPPTTVSGRSVHSANVEPTSLQPSSVASKNDVRRKSQPTKAVAVWVEALNRPPWKVHPSKTAPEVVASDRSTSVKVQSVNRAAPRSSPYQSSPRKWVPLAVWGSVTASTVSAGRRLGSSP